MSFEGTATPFAFEPMPGEKSRFAITLGGARRTMTALMHRQLSLPCSKDRSRSGSPSHDPFAAENIDPDLEIGAVAPMPGTIIALLAKPGETLDEGAPMLILEAMKMEHTLRVPARGRVARYLLRCGRFRRRRRDACRVRG